MTSSSITAALTSALAGFAPSRPRAYGTAGFRFKIDAEADGVFFRMGLVAWARACHVNAAVGLCVTASHNAVQDNGVKLIDPDGGMLEQAWEALATRIVNSPADECVRIVQGLLPADAAAAAAAAPNARVILARDTRPHSARLEALALDGVLKCMGRATSEGLLTTPQLHYIVMRQNGHGNVVPGVATETGYYQQLGASHAGLLRGAAGKPMRITVDCANGIGALQLGKLARHLASSAACELRLVNTDVEDAAKLNHDCGAEHVQKERKPPAGLPDTQGLFASFDGDADRIVFFYFDDDGGGQLRLLDGDKIACLFAAFVKTQVATLGLVPPPSIGCVQTAYANGASSAFLAALGDVAAPLVKTGVKHLHHKAVDYDVGVYFEANGHGTVLMRPGFVAQLRDLKLERPAAVEARNRVVAFCDLINQATGDAMSDLLAVEAVLRLQGWTPQQWDAVYIDLPSRQLKVAVRDRAVVVTVDDETRCVAPARLQQRVDELVRAVAKGRAFARPSGTEDVVRVYAEAETQAEADWLAAGVALAIYDEVGGVGAKPVTGEPPAKRPKWT